MLTCVLFNNTHCVFRVYESSLIQNGQKRHDIVHTSEHGVI